VGATFGFSLKADFLKIKDRETLGRSHNLFNTTEKNMGLSTFSTSIELYNVCLGI
jgi:hypothetical protein